MADVLLVCLFCLGTLGSVWSIIYALLDYHAERMAVFDDLVQEVVYREVYPQFCLPLLHAKLRAWRSSGDYTSARRIFVSIRSTLLLTPDESRTFRTLCHEALSHRRLWLPRSLIDKRIDDVTSQYMWHFKLQELLTYLDHVWGESSCGSPSSTALARMAALR